MKAHSEYDYKDQKEIQNQETNFKHDQENNFRMKKSGSKSFKLIKLAKMAGVMHEADHAYSIRSTW